jgi:ribosomal peptide maturation radical SAM protein 1
MVCMPFQEPGLPSVAVATLSGALRRRGHDVRVFHFHLDAAAALGLPAYHVISRERSFTQLLGEWLFAHPSIAPGSSSLEEYRQYLRTQDERLARLPLESIRRRLDARVEAWFAETDWGAFDVVGFSALFQQLNASLRLARAIKDRFPRVRVVFGGAALEGPGAVALRRRHAWIDAVFSGYSERTLPDYVERLPDAPEPNEESEGQPMDELPIPEYADVFDALRASGVGHAIDVRVPIETSRGCWWGERHHCTFCGLNGLQMRFREKSPPRIADEIARLAVHGRPFAALDSIMSKNFLTDVLPELARRNMRYDAFYEIKSNVTRGELETMASFGIKKLQPGVESLSTSVLKTMRKGVTGVHNLWLLRAAEELELTVGWNYLYGFPDEDPAEYGPLAAMVPAIAHLPPPVGPRRVEMVRFAPLYEERDRFGLRNVRPTDAYRHAFGAHEHLLEQAYVFDFEYGDDRRPDEYASEFVAAVRTWARI